MSFYDACTANLVSMVQTVLLLAGAVVILLGRPAFRSAQDGIETATAIALYIVVIVPLASALWLYGIFDWPFRAGVVFLDYVMLAGMAMIIRLAYRKSRMICWGTAVFADILTGFGIELSVYLNPMEKFDPALPGQMAQYLFYLWIVAPICSWIGLLALGRFGAGRQYRMWADRQAGHRGFLIFLSLTPVLEPLLQQAVMFSADGGNYTTVSEVLLLLIVYMMYNYIGREEIQRRQIEAQKVNLQQQKAYIDNLEGLQREVRRFRHDFNNMMSGMYLTAKEGDVGAVQSYIQQITCDFDRQVGGQIRLMNQLVNVRQLEVKGLLLGKLEQMQKENIPCELEVQKPFTSTRLKGTDLCRCLGILLDNAIEEVRGREEGKIHIMISSQKDCTTFLVRNTLCTSVDFHRLGEMGYSTKGEGRGLGLANYRSILERYDFALSMTTVKDGFFVQELKII